MAPSGWIMRCSDGHVYPENPVRRAFSLHFGPIKLERCPVDHHWRAARHVAHADLTGEERAQLRRQGR